ncbi:MAG: glutamine amidotransferase [Thermaerobacter sp.]|nr:glutamine amidotransferase [Thermaerobacter sp.]
MRVCIAHLYPELMNLYGDRGNVIALERRAAWRGWEVEMRRVGLGDPFDLGEADLIFLGGGEDRSQQLIFRDLLEEKAASLRRAVEQGAAVLAICGGYQLLGRHYRPAQGDEIPGLGLLDAHTEAGERRLIGDVVAESPPLGGATLVGFENHSGRTFLGEGVTPLARVRAGFGNNGEDGTEGAVWRGVVGTYLHGAVLPKNPALADYLLRRAMEHRAGRPVELAPLDDAAEERAHRALLHRPGGRR